MTATQADASAKPKATGRKAAKPAADAKASEPSAKAAEAAKAEALIGEVDALPGPEHIKRVGDADVQTALETRAAARMLAD